MSDITNTPVTGRPDWTSKAARGRVRRRYSADRRLQFFGLGAIFVSVGMLLILLTSLVVAGHSALWATKIALGVFLDPAKIDRDAPEKANYRKISRDALQAYFPEVTDRREKSQLNSILSNGTQYIVRDYVVANPDKIGELVKIPVPVSDTYDQLNKGVVPRVIPALTSDRIKLLERLRNRGVLSVKDGQTYARIDIVVGPDRVPPEGGIEAANFQFMAREAFETYFITSGSAGAAHLDMIDDRAGQAAKAAITANPSPVGKTFSVNVPLTEVYDQQHRTGKAMMLNPRFKSEKELAWFDQLVDKGLVKTFFSWELFTNADSRFPELAGLAGALSGSFFALLVCFLLSFPIGIAAAVYLEEFAPKGKISDVIEVNINNLAAVPSVVFGLLGLAVFIGAFGLPRSAPLVGGMVLSLMTLPTIIVATRAALKAVPPSIREGALGVGASKHQVVTHHVLPLAMPGILTGTIIGLAQALGETAPLLLIGMNAFIPSVENMGVLQPAMALPTQIFSWADSPERGFVARTSAAILVLLTFLIFMNIIAVYLRNRLERKW